MKLKTRTSFNFRNDTKVSIFEQTLKTLVCIGNTYYKLPKLVVSFLESGDGLSM